MAKINMTTQYSKSIKIDNMITFDALFEILEKKPKGWKDEVRLYISMKIRANEKIQEDALVSQEQTLLLKSFVENRNIPFEKLTETEENMLLNRIRK